MDRHRHHPKGGAGQHHHRAAAAAGKGRQVLGVAGEAEAAFVEGFLVNGIGDHGQGLAGADERHRRLDRAGYRGRVFRVRVGREVTTRQRPVEHRQRFGKDAKSIVGAADRPHRYRQAEASGKSAEPGRVVHEKERRQPVLASEPCLQRYFAADSRRLAHCQHQRPVTWRAIDSQAHVQQRTATKIAKLPARGCRKTLFAKPALDRRALLRAGVLDRAVADHQHQESFRDADWRGALAGRKR